MQFPLVGTACIYGLACVLYCLLSACERGTVLTPDMQSAACTDVRLLPLLERLLEAGYQRPLVENVWVAGAGAAAPPVLRQQFDPLTQDGGVQITGCNRCGTRRVCAWSVWKACTCKCQCERSAGAHSDQQQHAVPGCCRRSPVSQASVLPLHPHPRSWLYLALQQPPWSLHQHHRVLPAFQEAAATLLLLAHRSSRQAGRRGSGGGSGGGCSGSAATSASSAAGAPLAALLGLLPP